MTPLRLSSLALASALAFGTGCGMGELEIDAETNEELISFEDALSSDSAALAPGRLMLRDGIGALVPRRGEGVVAFVELEGGRGRMISISTGHDGKVVVAHEDTAPIAENEGELGATGQGLSAACSDGAYRLAGPKWTTTYKWQFRSGSTPSENSVANVEQALREAANNITGSRNDCGLADSVSATNSYAGRTTAGVNISSTTSSIACGSSNGVNVVDFGPLPKGTLGIACYWYSNGAMVGGDIRLNKAYYNWFAGDAAPSGCTSRYGVEAVATHEFGHVFGLGHVSEVDHPTLTMSTKTSACNASASSLGLGDVRALRALY